MNLRDESLTSATSAALLQLLDAMRARVGETAVDLLWIFSPQAERPAASGVVVAAAYDENGQQDRRRVFTAHFVRAVTPGSPPATAIEVTEHGSTPLERVEGLIEGVLRRMEDGPGAYPPQRVEIGGAAQRWAELSRTVEGGAGAAAGAAEG